jgi:hypothetical protein
LWGDDGSIVDLTASLNNYRADTETVPLVAADDYIYIGSDLPFNHKFIEMSTASDEASVVSVDIWWANAWTAAVDLIDQTDSSGATLGKSGLIQWNTGENLGWDPEQDSADVTGLAGTKIYDMYWVRLAFSADLAATTALKYVGHKFCTDDDLFGEYAMLKNTSLMAAWETGKTDWSEQEFSASEDIVVDLKRSNVIKSPSQLLDPEILRKPCIHKTAEKVFHGLGSKYIDMKKEAAKAYKDSLDLKMFVVDRSGDGRAQPSERYATTGWLNR